MIKILFLTPSLPFPPHSGGKLKSFYLLQYLSHKYSVSLFSLIQRDDIIHIENFKSHFDRKLSRVSLHDFHLKRTALNFFKSILKRIPLGPFRNFSPLLYNEIEAEFTNFDIIFCDHYLMFQYIPKTYFSRVILHQHNAEFLIWHRKANLTKNLFLKWAIYFESYRIKKYEISICNQSQAVLCAPNDIKELKCIGATKNNFFLTFHLGNETELTAPLIDVDSAPNKILFIGTLTWDSNRDAIFWFAHEIWPTIKANLPDAQLSIIGRFSKDDVELNKVNLIPGINLVGFVENLESHYQNSKVFVAPLRSGSGIKVKVVNALYRGLPVVTTDVGIEGLDELKDGVHYFKENDPIKFAEKCIILLRKKSGLTEMAKSTRETMSQRYSWERVYKELENAIQFTKERSLRRN